MAVTHGRPGTYSSGCHCGPCTEANRKRGVATRSRLAARPDGDVPHGSSGYVNWYCRCDVCSDAHRLHNALSRARRKVRAGNASLTPLEAQALADVGGV